MLGRRRLLLIDEEEKLALLMKLHADLLGFRLEVEHDGTSGLRTIERQRPDLILLDTVLPGLSGFDVCRKIRAHPQLRHLPIIFVSRKIEEIDVILGLELGADDFVLKPCSPKILFSRIKAVLRRAKEVDVPVEISFGDFGVDLARFVVKRQGKPLSLTLSEFGILRRLLLHRGEVLSRAELLCDVCSDEGLILDRNIDVHIASLRRKLGPDFLWIETVRGVGYRFLEDLHEDVGEKVEEALVQEEV